MRSLALKILVVLGYTDMSKTSFKSVKTLGLFVCTSNKNKSRFCEIKEYKIFLNQMLDFFL